MVVLPSVITREAETPIATYNFREAVTGTGFLEAQGYDILDSTGSARKLSDAADYSANPFTSFQFTTNGDKDFDNFKIKLLRPIIIEGEAKLIMPIHHNAGSRSYNVTMRVDVIKNTSTTLVTIDSDAYTSSSTYKTHVMHIDIPRTNFGAGDTLELNIVAEITGIGGSGTADIRIYHDPTDTAVGTLQTTKLKFNIPVFTQL